LSVVDARRAERVLAWKGVVPVRVDAAQVTLQPDRLRARGTSAVAGYTLDWLLDTGPAWVTRGLSVRARGDGWARSLDLGRDDDGRWLAVRDEYGRPAERLDVGGLDGALDCDLALCPFTNTMPVLRHGLIAAARRGEQLSVDLVMAWVAVPELTLRASAQRYSTQGQAPDGGALLGYASGDFQTSIEVDRDIASRLGLSVATRLPL
jgi:hypothetical protein